jgi:hypothetical protein
MPLRTQRAVLAAKIEVTEGTAETLAAADGVLALQAAFQRNQEMNARNPFRPTLSQLASVAGKRTGAMTCQVEMKGSGTAGTAPEWGKLLRACGFGETTVPATSVTYLPVSTGDPSLTIGHYQDGIRHLVAGARGTFSFGGAVGEIPILNFSFLGVEDVTADVAIISPTYQTSVPRALKGLTFTLHGVTVVGSSFSIDIGNTITPRVDFTKASGHASVFIGDRVPVCNFVVEKPLVASKDWYGIWDANTESTISMVIGTVAGNIMTITSPKFQITGITEQDDGGIAKLSIDGKLNLSTGDDELSIALT